MSNDFRSLMRTFIRIRLFHLKMKWFFSCLILYYKIQSLLVIHSFEKICAEAYSRLSLKLHTLQWDGPSKQIKRTIERLWADVMLNCNESKEKILWRKKMFLVSMKSKSPLNNNNGKNFFGLPTWMPRVCTLF